MFATLGELDAVLADLVQWSRPGAESTRYVALNNGYRTCVRAVKQVRPEYFLQEFPVTLPAGVYRVPLEDINLRPIHRIKSIQVFDPGSPALRAGIDVSSAVSLRFQYASIESDRFQLAQSNGASATDQVYYDLVFPLAVSTTPGALPGMHPIPTLALAPALAQDVRILLETIYHPADLLAPDDPVEPVIQPHGDTVVALALAWLLQTVNDVEAGRWREQAFAGLAELRDSVAQVSQQNIEYFDSGLGTGD